MSSKMSQQPHGTTTEQEKSGKPKDQGKSQHKHDNSAPMDRGKSGQHDQDKSGNSDRAGDSGRRS
jgi:hypothetical protein